MNAAEITSVRHRTLGPSGGAEKTWIPWLESSVSSLASAVPLAPAAFVAIAAPLFEPVVSSPPADVVSSAVGSDVESESLTRSPPISLFPRHAHVRRSTVSPGHHHDCPSSARFPEPGQSCSESPASVAIFSLNGQVMALSHTLW